MFEPIIRSPFVTISAPAGITMYPCRFYTLVQRLGWDFVLGTFVFRGERGGSWRLWQNFRKFPSPPVPLVVSVPLVVRCCRDYLRILTSFWAPSFSGERGGVRGDFGKTSASFRRHPSPLLLASPLLLGAAEIIFEYSMNVNSSLGCIFRMLGLNFSNAADEWIEFTRRGFPTMVSVNNSNFSNAGDEVLECR